MAKKGFLLVIALLSLFLIILTVHSQEPTGCCTAPGHPLVCTRITAEECCGTDTECIANHFHEGKDCTEIPDPTLCTDLGCCYECCVTGCPIEGVPTIWAGMSDKYKAFCEDRTRWIEGPCPTEECTKACCVCLNETGYYPHYELTTETECAYECRILQAYPYYLFNLSITDVTECTETYLPPCSSYTTQEECGAAGCYWYDESCHSEPPPPPLTGNISGIIRDQDGIGLPGVSIKVTIDSMLVARNITNETGNYLITDLELPRTYNITASKTGYSPNQTTATINETNPTAIVDLTLTKIPAGTITGLVNDTQGRPISGALIYINGSLEIGTDPTGRYTITKPPATYRIWAEALGYQPSITETRYLPVYQTVEVNFTLIVIESTCVCISLEVFCPAKKVPSLTANHILGVKAVKLTWQPPEACNNIAGYYLIRDGETINYLYVSREPPHHPLSFIDYDVNWKETYNYEILAVYDDNILRNSSEPATAAITIGDPECRGKYLIDRFTEFCQADYLRKTCNEQNKVINATRVIPEILPIDCSEISPTFFCSGPDYRGLTYCKNVGNCAPRPQQATPFGLYYEEEKCYGEEITIAETTISENYCYYDYSHTIIDACYPCSQELTCFDYRSKTACEKDNCIAANTSTCSWISTFYSELGKGLCYQEGYNGTDYCDNCSKDHYLFENHDCNQTICSALGNCFADATNSNCLACTSCNALTTQEQCIGGQNFTITGPCYAENFIPSNDACGLGKCKWGDIDGDGINECFKDGNDNNDADCEEVTWDTPRTKCVVDMTPPETKPLAKRLAINKDTPLILTSDEDAYTLTYCVDASNTCCPDTTTKFDKGQVILTPDQLLEAYNIKQRDQYYFIRYYATDIFYNQELLKSTTFFADLLPPNITIIYDIEQVSEEPVRSDLTFTINLSEEATCTDNLTYLNTCNPNQQGCQTDSILSDRGIGWQLTYTLPDGWYKYQVTCTDDTGNTATTTIDKILIDAVWCIDIIFPKGPIKATDIIFNITTQDKAICILYNEESYDFNPSVDKLSHQTSPILLPTNTHYSNFIAICNDLITETIIDEQEFYFTIDNQAPITNMILTSDELYYNLNDSEWELWFWQPATIDFICTEELIGSFGCKETKYCILTDIDAPDCDPETSFTTPITLESTTKICYYSEDYGDNQETTKCGIVHIGETIGIYLINPPYNVSNIPIFDVEIRTERPTVQCKYAAAPDFDFKAMTRLSNIFTRTDTYEHKRENFPQVLWGRDFSPDETFRMYIKCNDTNGYINHQQPAFFLLMYDPSPPLITAAYAEDNPVVQGYLVYLHVETDDLTICKLSKTEQSYANMPIGFEGWDEFYGSPSFRRSHVHEITINSEQDDQQTHTYYVACQNRAGNTSSTQPINFSVDLEAAGKILSTSPSSPPSIKETEITLQVITNKAASCRYQDEGDWKDLSTTDGTTHEAFRVLSEGAYTFDVECTITETGNPAKDAISFIIDLSPPNMTNIEDGNFSCGDEITPLFEAEDTLSPIAYYNYSVYEFVTENLTLDWTLTTSNNPTLTIPGLKFGKRYYFKANPIDAAGNIGNTIPSDGFLSLPANATECKKDKKPPTITIKKELTYKGMKITISCSDDTGCADKFYGISAPDALCNATEPYEGPIYLKETSNFCWKVYDVVGNKAQGSKLITVNDQDEDGVPDDKDICPDTPTGQLVDQDGCSASQRLRDSDGDKVPDERDLCPDTPFEERDLVDEDGCSPSQKDQDKDGILDELDQCPDTPFGEPVDAQGCSDSQKDSDGDGMDDAWEIRQGLNHLDPTDADKDPDKDTLTNKQEYNYFKSTGRYIDVHQKDTDGDDYDDGKEVEIGTDPTNPMDYPKKPRVIPITILILGLISLLYGLAYSLYLHVTAAPPIPPVTPEEARKRAEEARPRALLEQRRRVEEARRRTLFEAKRKAAIEHLRRVREAKLKKRRKFFAIFAPKKKKEKLKRPEKGKVVLKKPKPKPLPGKLLAKEEFKPLREVIKIPKEKEEFERLAELTEERIVKKRKLAPLLEITKIPPEKKDEFEKLTEFIEERIKIPAKRPKELTEEQRKELRGIFYQLSALTEAAEKKKALPSLALVAKPPKKAKPKPIPKKVFKELKRLPKKKPKQRVFKKLRKLAKEKKKK